MSNFQKYYLEMQANQQKVDNAEVIRLALALPDKEKKELLAALLKETQI